MVSPVAVKISASALFAVALAVLVGGCASGPRFDEVQASLPSVPQDQGRIFFYRTGAVGAAVQPEVRLNGSPVGKAAPRGFFFVDRVPGHYEVRVATEVEKSVSFQLEPGQRRYVRLDTQIGLVVGRVVPRLVDEAQASQEIQETKLAGSLPAPSK